MGKKKLQGADGINFQMQLTIKGLEQYINNKGVFTNAGRTHISRHYIEA